MDRPIKTKRLFTLGTEKKKRTTALHIHEKRRHQHQETSCHLYTSLLTKDFQYRIADVRHCTRFLTIRPIFPRRPCRRCTGNTISFCFAVKAHAGGGQWVCCRKRGITCTFVFGSASDIQIRLRQEPDVQPHLSGNMCKATESIVGGLGV